MKKILIIFFILITNQSFSQQDFFVYQDAVKLIKSNRGFIFYCEELKISNKTRVENNTFSICFEDSYHQINSEIRQFCDQNPSQIIEKKGSRKGLKKIGDKGKENSVIEFSDIATNYFIARVHYKKSRASLQYFFKFENGILHLEEELYVVSSH